MEASLATLFLTKLSCLFLRLHNYLSNIMVSTIQTLPQIKSPKFISQIKQHLMTSLLTSITNGIQEFVKCCLKSWMPLNFRPTNMLFGRLQSDGRKDMFYLMTHSTLFIYGYMASNVWQIVTQTAREEPIELFLVPASAPQLV